jgi:exopolyphosphatase/guanosine-5'-triphosphate,3'-diphosphate pyrophosphatase
MTIPTSRHAEEGSRAPGPTLAALDLGTNNCRLLVARPRGQEFEVVDSFSRIVRLGEGVVRSGRLTERAMARTLAALRICARIMARNRVERARCVATEACRRALNGVEFLARVQRSTGLELEILPNDQEGRLALLGCLPLVEPLAEHVILIDIGGGSTELLWMHRQPAGGAALRCTVSLPVGVVSLTESFVDRSDEARFEDMVRHVQGLLVPIEAVHRIRAALSGARVQMLGTSGTVTTLAAFHLNLPRYDRRRIDGLILDAEAIDTVSRRLREMSNHARATHPCIGPGRADLVVAGCAILEAVLRSWPVPALRVADRGLREGILHGLMGRSLEHALARGDAATDRIVAGSHVA